MKFLNKEPHPRRVDSNTERKILKKIPLALLLGTLIPLLAVALMHGYFQHYPSDSLHAFSYNQESVTELFFYMMLGLIIFYWTMVLTVALGCVIMIIMKGPVYTADSYQLSHKDKPSGL